MAGKDTTRKDVPGSDRDTGFVDESKDRPLTPREEALASIKGTRLKAFDAELVEAGGQPVFATDPNADDATDAAAELARIAAEDEARRAAAAPKPAPAPGPVPAKTQAELDAEEAAKQAGAVVPTDPTTMVKVKVDGEDMEVPYSQIVANYQKTAAADKRLRDATADADRIRREAAASPTSAPAPGPAPAAPPAAPAPAGKKWTEALFEGDEDGADAAIAARIQEGVQEAIKALKLDGIKPTEDQAAEIEERVTQRFALNSVLQQSRTDYPMLYSDPDFEAIGRSKIERRMAEGVPFVDALHAVETEMAAKFGWTKTAATTAPAPARNRVNVSDRLDRKGTLDALPTATARRAAETEAEPPLDENVRAARGIEQLRAGRPGQQQA